MTISHFTLLYSSKTDGFNKKKIPHGKYRPPVGTFFRPIVSILKPTDFSRAQLINVS